MQNQQQEQVARLQMHEPVEELQMHEPVEELQMHEPVEELQTHEYLPAEEHPTQEERPNQIPHHCLFRMQT
jgi:hypothetical protein